MLLGAAILNAQTPQWQWTRSAGGSASDHAYSIARDNAGNIYVTGDYSGQASFGSHGLSSGHETVFVAKLDSQGNWLWAVSATGSGACYANSIATDNAGHIYVVGNFNTQASFGTHSLSSEGQQDVFVAKLDAAGNWLWAVRGGGTDADYGVGIAVDNSGNAFVTGSFGDTADFGQTSLTINPADWICDIFIAKLDSDGNWLWANRAGGSDPDSGNGIALDSYGNCYVTGVFYDDVADFGPDNFTANECDCLFVSKLSSAGAWLWTRRAGGTWPCYAYGREIDVDAAGNCYVAGMFSHTILFGATALTCLDEQDICISKLDPDGNWLWSKRAGGTGFNEGRGIGCDPAGNCCVTGYFSGTGDFGPTNLVSAGLTDVFIAALDTAGNWLWSVRAGGQLQDSGQSVKPESDGQLNLCGYFRASADFGPTQVPSSGEADIFVTGLTVQGTGVADAAQTQQALALLQVRPNPCRVGQNLRISCELPDASAASLEIFNIRGQKVESVLVRRNCNPYVWNTQGCAPGLYFCRLSSPTGVTEAKILLLR
ncbi:MAG: SBBP repeat-containing protein [Candidatus Cloacimonetes bacterium]|nr:SBBP repeat-containing protein [Candidatus Cloacimonadota bacterium]